MDSTGTEIILDRTLHHIFQQRHDHLVATLEFLDNAVRHLNISSGATVGVINEFFYFPEPTHNNLF